MQRTEPQPHLFGLGIESGNQEHPIRWISTASGIYFKVMRHMVPTTERLLAQALVMLDAASTLEHFDVAKALEPAGKAAKESGETADALRFEFIAVYLALYDRPNVWGTYYGPEMSSIDKDGNRFDSPPLESIKPECIAYWTTRMNAARHPALRARYADMVWDLSHRATGNRPPIDAARVAIDGYAEALTEYPEMSYHSWGDIGKRTIDLALFINDNDRLRKGKLVRLTYEDIQFRNTFLELGMKHLFEKHSLGSSDLFARVIESPVWHEQRHAILRRGIEAHFADDPVVSVHVLVPEIENAVRIVAAGLGLALQKQNRMGGFDLKNLGDLLADETVAAFLTKDIVTYLRVVFTDRRGWNLRNNTCHGILPAACFTQAASHRLLHVILLLSAVRSRAETDAQTAERPHQP